MGHSGSSLGLVPTSTAKATPDQVLSTWAPPASSGPGRFGAQRRQPWSRPAKHVIARGGARREPRPHELTGGFGAGGQSVEQREQREQRQCGVPSLAGRCHGHGSGEGGGAEPVGSAQPGTETSGWVGGPRQSGAGAGCGRAVRSAGCAAARIRFLLVGGQRATDPAAARARHFRNFTKLCSQWGPGLGSTA